MFDGQNVLTLDGDHLDISFRSEDTWPVNDPGRFDQELHLRPG